MKYKCHWWCQAAPFSAGTFSIICWKSRHKSDDTPVRFGLFVSSDVDLTHRQALCTVGTLQTLQTWKNRCFWQTKRIDWKNAVALAHLLLSTAPTLFFTQVTLRLWTPAAQVPFPGALAFRAADAFWTHGRQAEASQWKVMQGWSLQTRHSSRAGAAGQALPSGAQETTWVNLHWCWQKISGDLCH